MADGKMWRMDEWTDVELDRVARCYDRGMNAEQISALLGRPPRQIADRLKIVTNRAGRF